MSLFASLTSAILFVPGGPDLTEASAAPIQAIADKLRTESPGHVVIVACMPEGPLTLALMKQSEQRSRAVWEALVVAGAPPGQLSYRGFSDAPPSVPSSRLCAGDVILRLGG